MDYNDLHDPLQSAYKTAHSTESALLKVQNDILRTVDHGGVVVLVLLYLDWIGLDWKCHFIPCLTTRHWIKKFTK